MADPLSKAAPPPPSEAQLAHRRKQQRLVIGTLIMILGIGAAYLGYQYGASSATRADELILTGIRNLAPGKYEEAVSIFDKALSIDPGSAPALYNRGLAKKSLGQLEPALQDFQMAFTADPEMTEALVESGVIHEQLGDHAKAIQELTRVIELKPDRAAYYQRGAAYAASGQHQLAIEDFTWVIEKEPVSPYVFFARAKSKRALGDDAGASEDENTGFSQEIHETP